MNIEEDKKRRIYRKDFDDRTVYSIGLSRKLEDGSYENGFMPCSFKKGVSLENKTDIQIKKAWLTFYKKDNKTISYVFINEFEIVGQHQEEKKQVEDPFSTFGDSITIDDNFLD